MSQSGSFVEEQISIFMSLASDIVPFPRDISKCTALNASPYVVPMELFTSTFGTSSHRINYIDRLIKLIDSASKHGVEIVALLVGGSFLVRTNEFPKDLDGILFYSMRPGMGPSTIELNELWQIARGNSLDVRFVPYDANPIIALKACSFFSLLYCRTRKSAELSRGCVMVYPPYL